MINFVRFVRHDQFHNNAPNVEVFDLITVWTGVMDYVRSGDEKYVVEPWKALEWTGVEQPVLELE